MSVFVVAILALAGLPAANQPEQAEIDTAAQGGAWALDAGAETPPPLAARRVRWGAGVGGVLVRADTWDYAVLADVRAFVPCDNWDLGYIALYEVSHLMSHWPVGEKARFLPKLRRHHAIHHQAHFMTRRNFNVTLPLADAAFRTRQVRPQGVSG